MMMMMMMMIIIIIIIIIGWYKRSQATYASYVLGYEPGAHEHKKVLFFFFFFPRGRANESFNQTGSLRGPDFPISAHGHGKGFIHKFVCCLSMTKSCDFVRLSFKPCALMNKKSEFYYSDKISEGGIKQISRENGLLFSTLATLVKV